MKYIYNGWLSSGGASKLAELKRQAKLAKTYNIGDTVQVSDWIINKQHLNPDYGISSKGQIIKVTDKAVMVRLEGKHGSHEIWCPKSQVELGSMSRGGNPEANALVSRYESVENKIEQIKRKNDQLQHQINKMPYDILNSKKKIKRLDEKLYDLLQAVAKEHGRMPMAAAAAYNPEINRKQQEKIAEQQKFDNLNKQFKQLQKQMEDIKRRELEPLIIQLAEIEKKFYEAFKK